MNQVVLTPAIYNELKKRKIILHESNDDHFTYADERKEPQHWPKVRFTILQEKHVIIEVAS